MYFVTLSYKTSAQPSYKACIKRISEDRRNKIVVVCKQKGGNGNHTHYHLIVEPDCGRVAFSRRFAAYMKPVPNKAPALNIKKCSNIIYAYNYCIRDPTYKFIYHRGVDFEKLKKDADFAPDVNRHVVCTWRMIMPLFRAAKFSWGDSVTKTLRLIQSKGYDVDYIVANPRRLALLLRFHFGEEYSYDDVFITVDNKLTML